MADVIVTENANLTTKTSPVLADRLLLIDSETNPNSLKDVESTAIKDLFKTSYDALYAAIPVPASTTSAATHTPVGSHLRYQLKVTAQAEAFTIAEPSGTPAEGNMILLAIKDNGTARAITWNAIYVGEKPTTTVLGKWLYIISIYNSTSAKWYNVSKWQE